MLRSVLRDVARAALVASLLAGTGACSSSIDRDGFESSSFCSTETARLDALRTALGAEWIGLVDSSGVVFESGPRCTAGTCAQEIESAKSKPGGLSPGQAGAFVLVVSKPGAVVVAARPAELGAALGTIDSPEKVHFVMRANGYEIDCDRWVKRSGDGFEAIGKIMTQSCDPIVEEEHLVSVRRDATISVLERVEVDRDEGACVGRRPEGLVSRPSGGWFARAAHLEAASVEAFRVLARELALHEAPSSLIAEAERSARDEIRHAAMMTRLAMRFGERVEPPIVEHREPRSLFELARENAIEGCVRETYGAVEAMMLAELETDPQIARVMHAIARDETRHAELSWSVASWANERLSHDERREISAAMDTAIRELPDVPAVALMKERVWTLFAESRLG